jgi:alcohol dehydrogenase class IV
LFGGLALANAALGAAHGFAGPLGGMLHAPHGILCARILTGKENATAQDGVRWVSELVEALNIPGLSRYGLSEENFPEVVEKTRNANSFKGNPIPLNDEELTRILERAL